MFLMELSLLAQQTLDLFTDLWHAAKVNVNFLLFNYSCLSLEINSVLTGSKPLWSATLAERKVRLELDCSGSSLPSIQRWSLFWAANVVALELKDYGASVLPPLLTGWWGCSGTVSVSNTACWLSLHPFTYLLIESSIVQTDAFGLW